jgi:gamma-glutamyltranspeptidase
MTHSLGMPSGVITEGLGFMYNGCMAVFDPRPGRANSIAPGKARFSSICPTIVFEGAEPRLVIGAPGGTQIAMGVLQATLNVLEFGMPILEAISAPRFSATSDAIDVTNRIPRFVTRALEEQGYEVVRSHLGFGIAAVHGLRPRRHGARPLAGPAAGARPAKSRLAAGASGGDDDAASGTSSRRGEGRKPACPSSQRRSRADRAPARSPCSGTAASGSTGAPAC